jgi:hypothetical protein
MTEPAPGYEIWRDTRYETINDNKDPKVINPAGFHFTEMDDIVQRIINPVRTRLAARGESLYVNLNYVAFTKQVKSGRYIHTDPDEYAEFMLATFQHLKQKYGWVPDAIETILEPDNSPPWYGGETIGRAVVAAGKRLAAHGFKPEFIAPSTTCMNAAVHYLDEMLRVGDIKKYLKEVSYHRYCQATEANLKALASRAEKNGLSTSMLEWWDPERNNRHILHQDLKLGRNSSWQQATLVGVNSPRGLGIARADLSDPAKPIVTLGYHTRYTSLYYKYVRRGARRIGADSSAAALDPLAFVNTNGTHVVVVNALNAGSFSVRGLPAGTYGIQYTTADDSVNPPDQTIAAGQNVTASIPAEGVITVYGKRPSSL